MKTYHVFIASSLSFQKERDLMEKVLTERNNSELNIVVHRHEKNGDNDLAKGDTQEIINSEIRQCDVIIFFAGNWIRSKTIGEFNVAIEIGIHPGRLDKHYFMERLLCGIHAKAPGRRYRYRAV